MDTHFICASFSSTVCLGFFFETTPSCECPWRVGELPRYEQYSLRILVPPKKVDFKIRFLTYTLRPTESQENVETRLNKKAKTGEHYQRSALGDYRWYFVFFFFFFFFILFFQKIMLSNKVRFVMRSNSFLSSFQHPTHFPLDFSKKKKNSNNQGQERDLAPHPNPVLRGLVGCFFILWECLPPPRWGVCTFNSFVFFFHTQPPRMQYHYCYVFAR